MFYVSYRKGDALHKEWFVDADKALDRALELKADEYTEVLVVRANSKKACRDNKYRR